MPFVREDKEKEYQEQLDRLGLIALNMAYDLHVLEGSGMDLADLDRDLNNVVGARHWVARLHRGDQNILASADIAASDLRVRKMHWSNPAVTHAFKGATH